MPDLTEAEQDPALDLDLQAFLDLHAPITFPLADHGRPCGGRAVPYNRSITDVLATL